VRARDRGIDATSRQNCRSALDLVCEVRTNSNFPHLAERHHTEPGSGVNMAEWWANRPELAKWMRKAEVRRQNKLADFVRADLGRDEHISAIFPGLAERVSGWGESRLVAVVVTNQRLVVIRLGQMLVRPTKILATYSHDGLKAEFDRTARRFPAQWGQVWYGKLTLTGPSVRNSSGYELSRISPMPLRRCSTTIRDATNPVVLSLLLSWARRLLLRAGRSFSAGQRLSGEHQTEFPHPTCEAP
jgi:hypothetical protein